MKYASGQAPKLLDVVKLKEGPTLAVVQELRSQGKVRVRWVGGRRRPVAKVQDLVLLERAI